MVPVAFPSPQHSADNADHAGAVQLEIAVEGPQQELPLPAVLDVGVAEVELQLPVNVRRRHVGPAQQGAAASSSAYKGVPGMGV